MASVTVGIKSGPSKYDLMLALFERSMNNLRPVTFILKSTDKSNWWVENKKLTLHITEVGIKDGSGQSWCFRGQSEDGTYHKGWFRTDTREGTIGVEPPPPHVLDAYERMGTQRVLEDLKTKYGR
ncbi:hypothetical protein EPO34_01995 [Patescibacteria group bacterium]|nr:MAG: hypothetical protein EPO34_01995 [Patescibacteria group bacterium]